MTHPGYPGVEEPTGVAATPQAQAATPVSPANGYSLTAWGSKATRPEFDITCPSGQKCRARSLQIEDAMSLGILDSLDMFTPAAMQNMSSGSGGQDSNNDAAKLLGGLSDPERRASFFGTVNRVVAHCVVIPKVVLVDDGNLEEGTVFANDIPFADKMHIFREVFSARGEALTSFREGQTADVAPVETESGVPLPTQ